VSMDGVSFGAPIASGSWDKSSTIKKVLLRGAKARYVRLEGVQGVGGFCSASEVSVAGTRAP